MVQRCMTCSFGLFVHALRCGVSLGSKKSSRKFCFYLKYIHTSQFIIKSLESIDFLQVYRCYRVEKQTGLKKICFWLPGTTMGEVKHGKEDWCRRGEDHKN